MMKFLEHLLGFSEGEVIWAWALCIFASLIAMLVIRDWALPDTDLDNRPVMIAMYAVAVIFAPVIGPVCAAIGILYVLGILIWEFTWEWMMVFGGDGQR